MRRDDGHGTALAACISDVCTLLRADWSLLSSCSTPSQGADLWRADQKPLFAEKQHIPIWPSKVRCGTIA